MSILFFVKGVFRVCTLPGKCPGFAGAICDCDPGQGGLDGGEIRKTTVPRCRDSDLPPQPGKVFFKKLLTSAKNSGTLYPELALGK